MPDTTNIETLQTQLAEATREAARGALLRRLLAEFAPPYSDVHLAYRALLVRAQEALTQELARLDMGPEPTAEGTK